MSKSKSLENPHGNLSSDLLISLEPIEFRDEKLSGEDQGGIETFLGKHNQVRLGRPRFRNYIAELLENSPQLPTEIKHLVGKGYDFQHITTSLTLLPAQKCEFVTVDFSIELLAEYTDKEKTLSERPVAYEVIPQEIVHKSTYRQQVKSGFEVGGDVKSSFGKILTKFTRENSFERDGNWHVRTLYSYGVNFSEAGWRFLATPDHELSGDIRNLELIIQLPENTQLKGRFNVAAEIAVEVAVDRWLTKAFGSPPNNSVVAALYDLSD